MPPTSASSSQPSNPRSGAITTPTGDLHIPSSTRADGSLRKEIRIRPGYRPPEDIEVYKNRTAEAWKTRGNGGIPGAEGLKSSEVTGSTTPAGKNAKRREARKKAKTVNGEGDGEGEAEVLNGEVEKKQSWMDFSKKEAETNSHRAGGPPGNEAEAELDPEVEKEKQARNLKKKLRQARELREKKDKGQNLLPEQFEKVIKIQELIRQLDTLGFDSEGVKKD